MKKFFSFILKAMGVFFILFIVIGIIAVNSVKNDQSGGVEKEEGSQAPAVALSNTPAEVTVSTPAEVTVSTESKLIEGPLAIPGIMPSDIYLNLVKRGFEKEGPVTTINDDGSDSNRWTLRYKDGMYRDYRVDLYAENGVDSVWKVRVVNSEITNDNLPSKFTKWLFSFIATLPYDGSSPDATKSWVLEHVESVEGSETFEQNDVVFTLQNYGRALRGMSVVYNPKLPDSLHIALQAGDEILKERTSP